MKDAILDLAQQQMKAGGYDHLNFATIAEALNITRANIHHHFKNKERLALATTESYVSESLDFMEQMAQKHAGDFPAYLAELETLVIGRIRRLGRQGTCVCTQLIRESGIPSSLKDRAEAYFDGKVERFKEMIIASQANGTISAEVVPDRLALLASSVIMGIDQMALALTDLEAFANSLEDSLSMWIQPYQP